MGTRRCIIEVFKSELYRWKPGQETALLLNDLVNTARSQPPLTVRVSLAPSRGLRLWSSCLCTDKGAQVEGEGNNGVFGSLARPCWLEHDGSPLTRDNSARPHLRMYGDGSKTKRDPSSLREGGLVLHTKLRS